MHVGVQHTCVVPGSWPDLLLCKHGPLRAGCTLTVCWRCHGWNMIWMLFEMRNITLEARSLCHHGLKTQRLIMHQLWCICENFNVYCWGLFHCHDMSINIAWPRCCSFPLSSACKTDNHGLICLNELLFASTKHLLNNIRTLYGTVFNLGRKKKIFSGMYIFFKAFIWQWIYG